MHTHMQSIHPYVNRLVPMDLHIPRQYMCPPEEQFTFMVAKSHSQLFSCHYNLRSPKSQMRGLIKTKSKLNYDNVLTTAYKLSPVAVQLYCKPK